MLIFAQSKSCNMVVENEEKPLMELNLAHKGKHPGEVVKILLEERHISQRHLAGCVEEFPQTLWSIIHSRRSMNMPLADKIERYLHLPQGYLMTLQLFHDLTKQEKQESLK